MCILVLVCICGLDLCNTFQIDQASQTSVRICVYMCNCVYIYEGLGHYPYQASRSDRCVALLFSLSPRSARHGDQIKAEHSWYFLIDILLNVQQDQNVVNMLGMVPCKWLRSFSSFCNNIQIFVLVSQQSSHFWNTTIMSSKILHYWSAAFSCFFLFKCWYPLLESQSYLDESESIWRVGGCDGHLCTAVIGTSGQ